MTTPTGGRPGPGEAAPSFAAPDSHGARVTSEELRGRAVLLVFVPFAFTRVCGSEVGALRDARDRLTADGVQLVMASCDAPMTLRAWAEAEGLPFTLISDFWPHGSIARAYGAFNEMDGAADRVSVLIDPDGVIAWRTESPRGRARSVEEYLTAIRTLAVTA